MKVEAVTAPRATDPQNPWPGLSPFEEGDAEYFHGRDHVIADAVRVILRDHITLLFGLSGLGKTSLLRAGVFPALRAAGVFPVYIRLQPGRVAAVGHQPLHRELWRQCYEAIDRAAERWGYEPPQRPDAIDPWEYFRRRNDRFWGPGDTLVTPLLVFDQFEEVFSSDTAHRSPIKGVDEFLRELWQVVTGAPPPSLANRSPLDDANLDETSHDYLFRPGACKAVFSFREEFLAHVVTLAATFPAIERNHCRLQAMTFDDAVSAVARAGGHLLDGQSLEEKRNVSRAIVSRIVVVRPGRDDTSPAIDPSLLSLFCRELNERRQSKNLPLISASLAQSAEAGQILPDFYESSMRGIGDAAREFLEEELALDASRTRGSVAEERALKAGLTPAQLDALVEKRILRREEVSREGQPRLELTHDVLVEPALASKVRRAAERRTRAELARRRTRLRRRGIVAAGLIGLALLIIVPLAVQKTRLERERNALVRSQGRIALAGELTDKDPTTAALVLLEIDQGTESFGFRSTAFRALSQPIALMEMRHNAGVVWADISPDGRRIVTGSKDTTARLWSSDGSAPAVVMAHGDEVTRTLFSPDSRQFLTIAQDKTVRLWTSDGRAIVSFEHPAVASAAAFSPDGTIVATGAFDGTVRLWTTTTPLTPVLLDAAPSAHEIVTTAFDAAGAHVLAAAADGRVRVWPLHGAEPRTPVECTSGQPVVAAWFVAPATDTESTNRLSFAAVAPGGAVAVFTVDQNSAAQTCTSSVANPPDAQSGMKLVGKTLAPDLFVTTTTTGALQRLRFWTHPFHQKNGSGGAELFGSPLASATAAAPFNHLVAVGFEDGGARLWRRNAPSVPSLVLQGHSGRIHHIATNSQHNILVTASNDGTARLWRVGGSGSEITLPSARLPHQWSVRSVTISGDGTRVLTASQKGEAFLWAEDGKKIRQFNHPYTSVEHAAFSPSGKEAMFVDGNGHLRLWRVEENDPFLRIGSAADRITEAAFSPDGKHLLTISRSGVRIHSAEQASEPVMVMPAAAGRTALFAAFRPDGASILMGFDDGTAIVREWRTGRELASFQHPDKGAVKAGSFSADGTLVLTTRDDERARVWRVGTSTPLAEFQHARLRSAMFDPGSRRIVTAGADGKVRLWNTESGHEAIAVLTHADDEEVNATFSRDGALIVTTGKRRALLWRSDGAEAPLTIDEHSKELLPAVFAPSGDRIITGSADGLAVIVTIGPRPLIDSVRSRSRACLSADFRFSRLLEDRATAKERSEACEREQRPPAR